MRSFFQTFVVFVSLLVSSKNVQSQTTGFSGTGANIDVVYHRTEWTIDPRDASKVINGTVTTYFVTKQSNVSQITFDLNKNSFSNKVTVRYHNNIVASSFAATGNVLQINLPVSLPVNKLDSVRITYYGTPPAISGYAEGYQRKTDAGSGAYIYTLSESFEDRDWWPCKADMQDRIDSMDIIVTVPWTGTDTFWVAANGKLVDSSIISGDQRQFTFKHRYPIPSYLVALGIAKYNRYHRGHVTIGETNVPVTYNLFRGKTSYTGILSALDKSKEEMVVFSELFGDYPFKNEKHGFYEFGFSGGMEHQTFSGMGTGSLTSWSVIAHELAHQWFGDQVTFSTWNHLWLAEGFAKYLEALAAEKVSSLGQSAATHRSSIKSSALAASTTSVYLNNIANSDAVWGGSNYSALYMRGAMVVSMLRKLSGDEKFFQACRNFLKDVSLSYKSATTEDLKSHFEAVLNYDLDAFFQSYIYGTGNPAYDITWGSNGKNINIELTTQRRSNTSLPYFHTPVVINISNGLTGASKRDTTVVIYDENGKVSYAGIGIRQPKIGKALGYNLSFVPAIVTVDQSYETMVRGQDGVTIGANRVAQSSVARATRLNTAPIYLLPINITDFKGISKQGGNLMLVQLTTTDENISVQIERSENGVEFYPIGYMIKSDIGKPELSYNYFDKNVSNATTYYYRVKTVDEKDIVKYSKIVVVTAKDQGAKVKLSPIPTSSSLQIDLPAAWKNRLVTYFVYNSNGMMVRMEKVSQVNRYINISVQSFPSGSYTIKLIGPLEDSAIESFTVVH